MKYLLVAWVAGWLVTGSVRAQVVDVEIVTGQDQFLPNEDLWVGVRITNLSGQSLHLGGDDKWLDINVESRERRAVFKTGGLDVSGEFEVESSSRATRRINIEPHFDLSQSGQYLITASVRIDEPGWKETLVSSPAVIYIFNGRTIWQQEIGVPRPADVPPGPPVVRRYSLLQANFINDSMKLYMKIADATDGRVIKVRPVDRMAGFSRYEAQIDRFSNLHVLLQTPRAIAREYNYSVYKPDGGLLIRRSYQAGSDRAQLTYDEEGRISVSGARRVRRSSDVPSMTPPDSEPTPDPEPVRVGKEPPGEGGDSEQ